MSNAVMDEGENEIRTLQGGLRCDEEDNYPSYAINSVGPHCYSCHVSPEADRIDFRVDYDYELTWKGEPDEDFAQNILPLLESGLLERVASLLHVRICEPNRQTYYPDVEIVGVSSLFIDFRDLDPLKTCQEEPSDESLRCAPVKGSMSAEFIGDETMKEKVENELLDVIEKVMDSNHGLSGPIQNIHFIRNRGSDNGGGPNNNQISNIVATGNTSKSSDDLRVRNYSLATSAAALFLIMVVVGAAILLRRKPEKKREAEPVDLDVDIPDDDSDDDIENRASAAASGRPAVSLDLEIPSSPPRPETDADSDVNPFVDIEDADDTASTTAIGELPEALAAGPPTSPEEINLVKSETLKKRRKKKKKKFKKVATLVRVNSRENVASMETISETDEQEQQDNLDEDEKGSTVPSATYSTSDDESSAYSTASSDNEQDVEREADRACSKSPVRRRDLPPLPPVEF